MAARIGAGKMGGTNMIIFRLLPFVFNGLGGWITVSPYSFPIHALFSKAVHTGTCHAVQWPGIAPHDCAET